MSESEKYIPGTKRGEGITFERTDEEKIQMQKERIGKIVREKMKEKGLSYRKLQDMTSVYNYQIQAVVKGKNNYKIETLLRILNALDIEL
ncbi:helix-turn-helix domain-containing protein [Bacillus subtilis]|nr:MULTISPECIES: helix-turn-helix transcriptional regulator [Bacillus subtilis group]AVB12184.1 hypothetical protein C3438_22270 [Bacillus velezensis]MCB4338758.1 hypothetical protein [Bacillus subtilis]MCT6515407.1 helix-turn-helix transcriptional regulator [Bacillus subtilis]MDK7657020.1 helix-turn-helix transcriptional regulator [Bacillus subtilis]MDQ4711651.1 helix-turn-helix transcriptional regulator [Bacillus subtilis]